MSIETIAVLGAGQMGSGIAQIAAASGYKVIIRDIKQEFCDKGVNGIKAGLDKQVAKGKTTQEAADAIMARISTTVELEGVAPADFVIEAAPEILSLKHDTFVQLGEICKPDAILCTRCVSETGYVLTDMTKDVMADEKNVAAVTRMISLRRYAMPEEIAGVVNFVASPAGGYLTGVLIPVDGGMTIN